jgi:hypothetical protein
VKVDHIRPPAPSAKALSVKGIPPFGRADIVAASLPSPQLWGGGDGGAKEWRDCGCAAKSAAFQMAVPAGGAALAEVGCAPER